MVGYRGGGGMSFYGNFWFYFSFQLLSRYFCDIFVFSGIYLGHHESEELQLDSLDKMEVPLDGRDFEVGSWVENFLIFPVAYKT